MTAREEEPKQSHQFESKVNKQIANMMSLLKTQQTTINLILTILSSTVSKKTLPSKELQLAADLSL
jgi:hypothetical protein